MRSAVLHRSILRGIAQYRIALRRRIAVQYVPVMVLFAPTSAEAQMIILVAGEKGGCGKTTIATNLAVGLRAAGRDVMLLDTDQQATAAKWIMRRNAAGLPVIHCAQAFGDVKRTALDFAKRYDAVVIDAGGHDSKEMHTAMMAAEIVYTPAKPSQADLETLSHVDDLISMARTFNPFLRAMAVLSMVPTNPSITEAADARGLFDQFAELRLSDVEICERKAYRDALLEGRGVLEMAAPKARAEIAALLAEIMAVAHV